MFKICCPKCLKSMTFFQVCFMNGIYWSDFHLIDAYIISFPCIQGGTDCDYNNQTIYSQVLNISQSMRCKGKTISILKVGDIQVLSKSSLLSPYCVIFYCWIAMRKEKLVFLNGDCSYWPICDLLNTWWLFVHSSHFPIVLTLDSIAPQDIYCLLRSK